MKHNQDENSIGLHIKDIGCINCMKSVKLIKEVRKLSEEIQDAKVISL